MNPTRIMLGKRVAPAIMRPMRKAEAQPQQTNFHTHVHSHEGGTIHSHPHRHQSGDMDTHDPHQ